jgi:hypothetical protein
MSATRILEAPDSRLWYFNLRLSRQTLILLWYLPSILITAVGAIVLSICWVLTVNAAPEGVSVVLLTLIQLAWFASLVDVWLQNTYWVLGREHTHTSDADLRVPQVMGTAARHL